MFIRAMAEKMLARLAEKRRFIQVIAGPRQTGKTTIADQVIKKHSGPSVYATADEPALKSTAWIEEMWQLARTKILSKKDAVVLVLDEIQKVPHWAEIVKRLWDEDSRNGVMLHVFLLGSSPFLVQKGLSESLAGRFEVVDVPHWSFYEMNKAFKWDVDKYIYFGGYPGSAPLINENDRWARYIKDSLIETSISRDIISWKAPDL